MDVLYPCCAGLDVHKKTVTACRLTRDASGSEASETRTFSTMTAALLELSDWLQTAGVSHIAMESTGEYWKPIYNILEGAFDPPSLLVVNAHHVKNVPGRKTDDSDAKWLAQLLQHGLLKGSFVPPPAQRELRELTRHRANFIRERASMCNRLQKTLESANIKLASVATDVLGKSGRAILSALVGGETDPSVMAELALGRLREKREPLARALEGRVKAHHRFIVGELLCQIDSIDETIARFDAAIVQARAPFEAAVQRLMTIPGVGRSSAEQIIAETGADMSRFPTQGHIAAWGGVAPGNNESAGKRLSGRIRQGNPVLRRVLVQAAHAASHTKDTYLSAQYHRLASRRGKRRAIIAVAHSLLVMSYHMLRKQQDYNELGSDYYDRRQPQKTARNLVSRLKDLGYDVQLNPPAHLPAAA